MPTLALLPLLLSGGSDGAALARALESVRPESICADVRFIASDELEGRDTPSQGLRLAARYLRARLERLGFQPMGDEGYFDLYELSSSALDPERSALIVERGAEKSVLPFGRECFVFGSGVATQELTGGLTYVGAGKAADYQGLDLKGRFALTVASQEVRWSERTRAASEAGALGIVTLPDPDADPKNDWWVGMEARRSRVEGNEERTRGESLPQVWLSRTGARMLLGEAGLPRPGTALPVTLRDKRVLGESSSEMLENVCGFWPGSDPVLAKEVLVLSAHYDHVGKQGGEIHNGADDNGSGTCGLLALAEALKSYGPMRRSVLILWVSGEEKGLWGSAAWTKKPTLPEGYRAVANLNIDMIGRNAPEKLLITPTKEHEEYNGLTRLAESFAPLEGFPQLGSADEYWGRSDHRNFAVNLEIPVAFLFSDVHEDYHKPGDDAEKIDCDKIRRVTRLVLRMLDGLQSDTLQL